MDFVYIGKYVNTHGIKGEIRVLSDIPKKDLIFKKGFKIYIGSKKIPYTINTYRVHKNYDMLTFLNVNNINDIINLKGNSIYINRLDLDENIIFDDDYIGMEVYTDKLIGKVENILKSVKYDLLVINVNEKKFMVPNIDNFVKKIDLENRIIYINSIEGLIDEN